MTTMYEYRLLKHPTELDLNALGAKGFRIQHAVLDSRDGELTVFMERLTDITNLPVTEQSSDKAPKGVRKGASSDGN